MKLRYYVAIFSALLLANPPIFTAGKIAKAVKKFVGKDTTIVAAAIGGSLGGIYALSTIAPHNVKGPISHR